MLTSHLSRKGHWGNDNTDTRYILRIRKGGKYIAAMIQCYVVIIRNAKASSKHKGEVTLNKTKHINNTKYVIVPSSVVM